MIETHSALQQVKSRVFSRHNVTAHSLRIWMTGMDLPPGSVTKATAMEKVKEDVKWKQVIKLYDEEMTYQV